MSQNQNKQSYAHGFIAGGVAAGVGAMRVGGAGGTASASVPSRLHEQRHEYFGAGVGGGGGDYTANYWQQQQQQQYQQQQMQQQVFQQRQQRQMQQQLQQRQQQHQHQQQLQQRQQQHQLQQRQQQQHHLQQRQQQMQLQHRQQLQLQQRQQQMRQYDNMTMKPNTLESNVQVPTIEMDELIIKTEPPDDSGFVNLMENQGSKNVTNPFHRSTFLNNTSFPHIKEEPSTSQQKTLNFPRRKLQTERAETLPICQRCKQVFLKKSTYMKHVRHSSCSILEYNFKCLICPMSFMSQEELQVHENVHRADQFFCQKYCGKYFDTLDLCEAHEFMFHDFVIFTCNVCNGNFKTRDVLFAHKTQHRHLNRFDCPICRRWFSTPGELRKHRLEAPFYCGKFYAEKEDPDNQSIFNKTSWEETNYNLQDCNVGVIEEATPSIPSNQTQISKNNDSSISNFQPDITIKSEPDFDNDIYPSPQSSGPLIAHHPARTHQRSEASYHNVPTSYPNTGFNNFNTNINDHAYNDFKSHYQHLERTHDNNFTNDNFSPPFTPATPAVSENDAICCVPHCGKRKSTNPTLQFFKYPKDEKYLKQWLHNMKLIYNAEESYEDYRICNVHFPKRVINLHSLCYWAVPTYHLGHDDFANIFHNREQSLSSVQCGIRGCESIRGKTNVKFYNFPSSETQVYMKWCQNARLPLNSTEMRQICSRHFEEHCFGKLRLKNWALPTLHLGGFPIIHENPRILFTEDKKCCLQHCRRKRSENITLSFYGFPRDEQLLLRWCYNFRLDPNEYRGKFYKICSAHFVKDVIGTVKLLPGALPTLELGHNDPNIYTNDFYPTSSSTHHNTTSTSSNSSAAAGGIQETPDTCSLPTCKRNRFSDNVSMHTMPGRPEQFKKWCHNLKINPAKLNKHFRVCSIHFEPYCIGGCMRPFAVPTLFLGHDDKNIYHNPKVIKKLSLRETCCVAVCRRNRERDRANLHSFPLHKPELLQKWAHNLQRPMPDGTRLFNDAICEQHFEERCIQNRRLAKWAVPTLLLGHDDDLIQLPSEAEVEEMMAKTVTNEANNGDAGGECCVETCKRETNSEENVKLYFLPDDEEVLDKWAHNLQQPDIKEYAATMRICNLHFESYCIGKKLHSWAIPTLNLPHQLEHIFENPSDMKVLGGLKAPNAPRCCLPSCRKMRIDGQVQLFRFPTYSKSIFKKWCHNLQMSLTSASSSHKRLCSTHFEPCVLTKRCPMPQALPTLNLNCPENYKIYQNPERLKYAKLRNERICCLASCRKGKKDGIQLFLYPHNRNLLRKWAHNTKQKGSECTRAQLRLCSDHFEENCFGPARLVPGAIPTLKLGHDDTDIFPNTLPEISEDGQQCAITGCGRKRAVDGIRLFRFPADDEDLLWKWCNNLKLNPIDCPQQRICNMHFEPDCVGPKGLHKWAIPTMLLGHNDTELQLHTNPPVEERVLPEPILLKCCVARCGKTRKYDDVMLNSFPKTVELFKRWAHNLQMDIRFSDREKYKICNDHFETFCVGQARLRAGAIPTLNLGHDNTADIYTIERADLQGFFQPKQSTTEGSVKSVTAEEIEAEVEIAKCCYPDCTASKSLQRDLLFDFPKCELLANAWSKVIDLNETEISNPKLCGIHFIVVYDETAETRAELEKTNPELKDDLQVLANSYYRCCSSSLIRSMQCCIPECKTNSLTGIKLYQFPYQRDLKEKWAHNTAIELDENQRHLYKVCALHFEAHCITESQRLRPWAIPTLQLEHAEPVELYQNPDLLSLDRRLLGPQTNKCCVPCCERHENVDDNARLFNFPIEESIIDKWLHNLRVVEREKCPLYRICSWHFEKRCVSKSGRLRSWAIPTLKLRNDDNSDNDDDDDDIIQNPEKPGAASVASSVSSKDPQQTAAESEASSSTDVIKGCKMKKNLDLIKCCVATCQKRRLQHGVRFYTTPSDIKMIRKWSHILQLSVAELKKEQHICNEHFAKRCIDGKQLYAWAIPTMNLGSASISDTKTATSPTIEKTTTIEHETKEPSTQFNLYLPTCCVPNCGRRRTPENAMRTFGFPLNPKLLRRWCTNLRIDPSGLKGPRVCIYHFEEEVRGKQKLKPGTVPTLNLGHDDGPTYDNKALLLAIKEKENSALHAEASVENVDNTLETKMDTNLEESTENFTEISNENQNNCTTTKSADDDEHDADDVVEIDENKTQLFNSPTTKRCKQKNTLATPTKSDPKKTQETKEHTTQLNLYLPTCCVPNCGRRRTVENAMRTFGFPLDPELLRRWCTNLRIDPTGLKYPRVCVYHFEEEIRGKTKLKHGAVPTLNLGHDDGPTYDNKALLLALKDKENSTLTENPDTTVETTVENITEPDYENWHCAVTGCSSTLKSSDNDENDDDNKTQLFNFPSEITMLQKWCDNLQLKSDASDFLKVCKRHFEPQCFGIRTSLYMWAVPTLHLGLDELTPLPHDNSKYIKVVQSDNTLEGNLKRCCIATCQKTRRSHGVTLFSFPKPSQLLLRKWCHNTRQAFKRRQKRRICSDHFEKYTMSNGKLRAWALPTLQLGHTEPIYENPTNMFDKCCISTCESNENTQQLFSFPKRSSQLRKWAHNTKQDAYLAVRRNYKVCGLHFEKNCISASGLNFGAIPTLELGPQDVDDADLKENFANEVIATRDVQDVSCSIANCGRKLAKDGIILYPFPKDQELLEKWCHNLKLETEKCEDLYICNMHFETGLVRKYKLVEDAVPTLLLGHNDKTLELIKAPQLSNAVLHCCVPNCNKSKPNDDVQMVGFPKKPALYLKWIHNLKIKPNQTFSKVCSDHFEDICMATSRLKHGSIPTLKLGHDDTNIYHNSKKVLITAEERRKLDKCIVSEDCNVSKMLQLKLFDMPKVESLLQLWLTHFGVEFNDNIEVEPKICAIHFMDAYEKLCPSNDTDTTQETDDSAEENKQELANLVATYTQITHLPRLRILLCSVPGCKSKFTDSDIRLIMFPKNAETCAKWCHNTKVNFDEERRYLYKICSLHFEDYCYANTRLHNWAIPTLRLPETDNDIYQNPEPEEEQPEVCCVESCRTTNSIKLHNIDDQIDDSTEVPEEAASSEVVKKLFSFPTDEKILQKWCHNLDIATDTETRGLKICSAHFENYTVGKLLRPWAIPTLKLSHDPATLFTNPEIKDLPTGRTVTCCVRDCRQQRDDEAGIKLFAFPFKQELRQKWLHNLELKDHADDCKSYRVCSLHFERHCVGKRLHNWAIPTLRLCQGDETVLYKNPRLSKKKLNAKCCLKHCRKSRRQNQVRLYSFPETEPQILKKWLHNLRLDNTALKRKICSSHFEKYCIYKGLKRLHPWAIPTLELGHKDVIFENPKGKKLKLQQLPTAKERCALSFCEMQQSLSATGESTLRFFGFPCAEDLLQKWCDNLKLHMAGYRCTKQRICEYHFETQALNAKKLLPGAVPTLNLGHTEVVEHQNPADMCKYRMCSVLHCKAEMSKEVKLFDLPLKNTTLLQKWCENLQLDVEACKSGQYTKICNAHFVPAAFTGYTLKPFVVPTLKLGHNNAVIHENSTQTLESDAKEQCVVTDCAAHLEPHGKLFVFPKKPKRIQKWCENLKLNFAGSTMQHICREHFDSSCFDPNDDQSLLDWALPTLNLGHIEQLPYERKKSSTGKSSLSVQKRSQCCVTTCQQSKAQLYKFPTINWLVKKWCHNLRRPEEGTENLKICVRHFEKHCLGISKPKPWAIPTLELGHTGEIHQSMKIHKYHPEEKACGEMKFVRSNYCAIVSCLKSKQDGVQLYKYPSKGAMLHKWAHNCRHRAYQAARYVFRICREHFEDQCITAENRLRPGAIPTLKLGHDDIDIHPHEVLDCPTPSSNLSEVHVTCNVPNCGRTKLVDNVKFFKFPKDAEMLEKWCYNLRLEMMDSKVAKDMRICNMHFEERCFSLKKIRLLLRAVPTLLLGHNDIDDIYENPETFERPEKVLRCCVPDCGIAKGEEENVSLFCLPKNRKLFDQWVQNIRLDIKPTTESYLLTRVCSMHFEDYCSVGQSVRRLLYGAVPTLKLGHNDKNIHHVQREVLSSTLGELRKRKREEDSIKKLDAQCCVPNCNAKDYHIYALPQHAIIQHMWHTALGILEVKDDSNSDDEKQLCAIHFKIAYVKTHNEILAAAADDSLVAVLKDLTRTFNEISSSSRVRSIWCSVSGCCGNTYSGGVELKLHAFPQNSEIYEKWLHNTQVEVDEQQRYLFKVCSLHFEARCVKETSKRLYPWAVPTLNLPLKDIPTVIIQNPSIESLETKNTTNSNLDASCCIATCVNAAKKKDDNKSENEEDEDDEDEKPLSSIALYKFPRDVHLFRKWLYNTQMDANKAIHARICGRHFEHACIGKILKPWAIPTMHLGHNNPNIHQNPKEEMAAVADIKENEIKFVAKGQETKLEPLEKATDVKPAKELLKDLLKKDEIKCASFASLLSPKWEQDKIARSSTPKIENNKKPIILELLTQSCIKNSDMQENSRTSLSNDNSNSAEKSLVCGGKDEQNFISEAEEEKVNEIEEYYDDVIFTVDDDDDNDNDIDDNMMAEDDELLAVRESVIEEDIEAATFNPDEMDEDDTFDESAAFDAQTFGGTEFKEYNDEVFYSLGDEPPDLLYSTPPTEDIQSCRVAGCTSRVGHPDIVLHKFPSNALLRNRWLHNTKVKWDPMRPWAYKICSLHFESQYYTSMTNRLTAYAIPTLNLGHTRPEKIYDTAVASNWKPGGVKSTTQPQIVKKLEQKPLKPKLKPPYPLLEQPTSSFNFKITAIESISMNATTPKVTGADDDYGMDSDSNSVSSTEYQLQQYSDATNPASAGGVRSSNTTNLSCSIPSCQRKTNQDFVQLHMLPKDTALLQQWCRNCKLSPSPHELYTTRVCSYHFEDQCFTRSRRQLKLGSLPTLNLGHNDEIYQNLRQPGAPLLCCVAECGRRRVEDHARLFRFPTDKRMLSKWLHNLQMEFNAARPWNYNVCEKHFEDYCFGKAGSIMPWAVPTLHLGSNAREQRDLRLNERPLEDQINDDDLFIMPDSTPTEIESHASASEPNFNKKSSTEFKSNNVFYEQHYTFKKNLLKLKDDIKITTISSSKCIVPNCGLIQTGDFRMQMFALPKDPQLRQKWTFNMKMLNYTYNPDNSGDKICVRHFERSAILGPNLLKKSAVPTLNLGHNDRNIYLNVDEETKYVNHAFGSAADALQAMAKIKIEPFEEQLRPKSDPTVLQFHQYENQFNSPTFPADTDTNSSFNRTPVIVNTDSLKCFLKHCKRRRIDGVKLFRFPREQSLQAQWEHNLKMVFDEGSRERLFLCSTHFEPQFMGRKFLMKGAIPTLNLGHNDTNIFRADAWSLSEESSESVTPLRNGAGSFNAFAGVTTKQSHQSHTTQISCCVPGCGLKDTGSENVLFFPFPLDEKYARIWQQRFRINYDPSRRIKLRVCNIHFEPHLICRKSLVQHAVPTLNLPPPVPHLNKQLSRLIAAPITSPSTSSNTCNVTGCHKNTMQDNVKMFSKFPDDFELFTKWCYNLKIDPRKYIDGKYNVCSSHFEAYCIGGHSLRLWAVPTLNLGHNDANIHQVKRPAEMETKCCLPHCGRRRSTDGVTFYNFPKGDLYKTWCKILNIDELLYRNTDKKICSAHFAADCFNGLTLKAGVKPTLYLRARPAVATAAAGATMQHHQPSNQQLFKIHDAQPNVPGCLLTHCSNNSTNSSGVQFFAFPDKRYLCMKWCHNLRLNYSSQMLYNKRIYKICYKHFELSCIYNAKLHTEAVPTLELGHTDVNIFQNTGSFSTLTNDSSSISSSSTTGFANAMGGGGDNDSSLLYVKEEIMDEAELEQLAAEPMEDIDMLNNFAATFYEPKV